MIHDMVDAFNRGQDRLVYQVAVELILTMLGFDAAQCFRENVICLETGLYTIRGGIGGSEAVWAKIVAAIE